MCGTHTTSGDGGMGATQMDLPLDLKSTADSRWLATDVKV